MEEVELPVFSDVSPPSLVLQQPRPNNESFPGNRRQIAVSTIEQDPLQNPFINGLDFLRDTNQFVIQQTIELPELMSNLPSESRYTVKVPRGDTIYIASESSKGYQRTCFGPGRSFVLRLYDRTQQEVVQFKRRLACGNCTFWCYLQKLDVYLPPGDYIGTIEQDMRLVQCSFSIFNNYNEVIYKIIGPSSFGCLLGKHHFNIFTSDGATQIGSIIYQWDSVATCYNLLLQMPGNINDSRYKMLLIGSAFLLEYMYFQNSKSTCRCFC